MDEISERILTFQGKPLHNFEDYVHLYLVLAGTNISNDIDGEKVAVNSFSE
ncbi:MAG: hypothetical protein HN566_00075 [Polaribacter sp.]|nr:hypothetical protein [Polaribacter sp.]